MSYSGTIAYITVTDPKADKLVIKQSVIISDYFMKKWVNLLYFAFDGLYFLKEIRNQAESTNRTILNSICNFSL